jgi:homoserine acetyltransferase
MHATSTIGKRRISVVGWEIRRVSTADLNEILGSIKAKTLFLSNPRDQFIPKSYFETMVNAIPGARVVWIDSVAGHLMALNADPNATRVLGEAIRAFLEELTERQKAAK